MTIPQTIRSLAVFDLLAEETIPVQVRLTWNPKDPCAIQAEFVHSLDETKNVVWFIARDVLAAGLLGPSGFGDVMVYPVLADLRIVLNSPSGHAQFDTDPTVIDEFLGRTNDVCPIGFEYSDLDMDAELTALLEDAA